MYIGNQIEKLIFKFFSRLYIDLNHGVPGDEDTLDVEGFRPRNTFFITKTKKIRLKEVRKYAIAEILKCGFLQHTTYAQKEMHKLFQKFCLKGFKRSFFFKSRL